ncbi:GGDEF domain-containing protein [uncultured Desulfuromonas sp.]|uniref:GGDEF domain-containing protein n=1 Tax=uncultured Desulfuromonas sp. TaxID=181013 RepID=UPI00262E8795|nr:GGDEF domain-containing protein [uncultured Desulfuromonas sp.]
MRGSVWKIAWQLFVPGGVLAAAAVVLFHGMQLPGRVQAFLPFYPFLVLGIGLLLGWRFNRSRLVFVLLFLALADRALALGLSGESGRIVRDAVALLLPLNLAVLSALVERGIFTPSGLLRLGALAAQPVLLAGLYRSDYAEVPEWIRRPLVDLPLLEGIPLPQLSLLAFALGMAYLLVRFLRRPAAFEGGFLWALPAAWLPLAGGVTGDTLSWWFATAGLILVVGVVETSHRMAFRDELTGLPGRRALSEALLRLGRRYTLAMVDIDHFKKVNDRYGHDVGDQVLKMVAVRLAAVGGGGRAFRYGGEEFTLLFAGRSAEEVLPRLEGLREAVAGSGFVVRHRSRPKDKPPVKPSKAGRKRLSVTVSIGVAESQGEKVPASQVIKDADRALYRAKSGGRNRVRS